MLSCYFCFSFLDLQTCIFLHYSAVLVFQSQRHVNIKGMECLSPCWLMICIKTPTYAMAQSICKQKSWILYFLRYQLPSINANHFWMNVDFLQYSHILKGNYTSFSATTRLRSRRIQFKIFDVTFKVFLLLHTLYFKQRFLNAPARYNKGCHWHSMLKIKPRQINPIEQMRVGIRDTVEALKWEINFLCTVASASGFCDMNPACLGTQATVLICGCQNPSCVAFTEVRLMCTLASKSCDLKPKPYFFFSLIYCFCTASLTVFYESIKGY